MFVIPSDRLPPGFAERVETPPSPPAVPAPAATAVLLRDGHAGPEVLLLRRQRSVGFVPGAYVFAGGRVDPQDADERVLARVVGCVTGSVPETRYYVAALRELFEETSVLLARDAAGVAASAGAERARAGEWRDALLSGRVTLLEVLNTLDVQLDARALVYAAHWITPVAEPRRYDTRFFLAGLPAGCTIAPDSRETSDVRWLTPEEALRRFAAGSLPMIFPTLRTLEQLRGHARVDELLDAFRGRPVEPVLPRLVRTSEGVGIVVEDVA